MANSKQPKQKSDKKPRETMASLRKQKSELEQVVLGQVAELKTLDSEVKALEKRVAAISKEKEENSVLFRKVANEKQSLKDEKERLISRFDDAKKDNHDLLVLLNDYKARLANAEEDRKKYKLRSQAFQRAMNTMSFSDRLKFLWSGEIYLE